MEPITRRNGSLRRPLSSLVSSVRCWPGWLALLLAGCGVETTGSSTDRVAASGPVAGVLAPERYRAANLLPPEWSTVGEQPVRVDGPLAPAGESFLAQESYFDRLSGRALQPAVDAVSGAAGVRFGNQTLQIVPAAGPDFALVVHRSDEESLPSQLGIAGSLYWIDGGYRLLRTDGTPITTMDDMNLCGHVAVAAAVSGLSGEAVSPLASMLFQLSLHRQGVVRQPLLGALGTEQAGLHAGPLREVLAALLAHLGIAGEVTFEERLSPEAILARIDGALDAGLPAIVRGSMVYRGSSTGFRDGRIGRLWFSASAAAGEAGLPPLPEGFSVSPHWTVVLSRLEDEQGVWYRVRNTYTGRQELYPLALLASTVAVAHRPSAVVTFGAR